MHRSGRRKIAIEASQVANLGRQYTQRVIIPRQFFERDDIEIGPADPVVIFFRGSRSINAPWTDPVVILRPGPAADASAQDTAELHSSNDEAVAPAGASTDRPKIGDVQPDVAIATTSEPPSWEPRPVSNKGGAPTDRGRVIAEARRRIIAKENLPTTLTKFAEQLREWLKGQPGAVRRSKTNEVMSADTIEGHVRQLWADYRASVPQ